MMELGQAVGSSFYGELQKQWAADIACRSFIRALLHWDFVLMFIHGEFDPGSGRTLATCLRNASRTGEQSLVANGRVTRGQPALKRGTTVRKVC